MMNYSKNKTDRNNKNRLQPTSTDNIKMKSKILHNFLKFKTRNNRI